VFVNCKIYRIQFVSKDEGKREYFFNSATVYTYRPTWYRWTTWWKL